MFRIFSTALAALLVPCALLAADPAPAGLLLYAEPPSTYVELLRFRAIRPAPVITTAILTNGITRQVRNNAIIARLDYPDGTENEEQAKAALTLTRQMATKYSQFNGSLAEVASRWENALNYLIAQKARQLATARTLPPAATLTLGGHAYENPRLVAVEQGLAKVEHASGMARIDTSKLSATELQSLNATSTAIQITTMDVAKARAGATTPVPVDRPVMEPQRAAMTWPNIMREQFSSPPDLLELDGPNYQATIDFINSKLGPWVKIGYCGDFRRYMLRRTYRDGTGYATLFDAKELNPEVRYGSRPVYGITRHQVILQLKSDGGNISTYNSNAVQRGTARLQEIKNRDLSIEVNDQLDAEKVASAFRHLILMNGGKPDTF